MTTVSETSSATARTAVASARFRTFALVFGVSAAVLYVICDMAALPMFTYFPAIDEFVLGYAPPRRDEGPAMYWYGWIATTILGALVLGAAAALLPERLSSKIPLSLAWIVPIFLLPVLVYSLKFYWRW